MLIRSVILRSVLFASVAQPFFAVKAEEIRVHLPPRLQWNANGGYCGEVSMISAGLYYGQYMSQFDARAAAIGRTPQSQGELLLGDNDQRAARAMRLASLEWHPAKGDLRGLRQTRSFLNWVKNCMTAGYPTIIGVFTNEYLFYGSRNPAAGDPQYDHIVPASSVETAMAGDPQTVFLNTRMRFSDNGLWGTGARRRYFFTYPFRTFLANRSKANSPHGNIYSLPDAGRNFGIAITGIVDPGKVTLPVRVATNKNYEQPEMVDGSNQRPRAMPLSLTVTVSGLSPHVRYKLYRYSSLDKIPVENFNLSRGNASQSWDILIASGSTFTMTQNILSDEIAAYRCVAESAR